MGIAGFVVGRGPERATALAAGLGFTFDLPGIDFAGAGLLEIGFELRGGPDFALAGAELFPRTLIN